MSAVSWKGTSVGRNCRDMGKDGRHNGTAQPGKTGTHVPNPVLPHVSPVAREGSFRHGPVSSTPLQGKRKYRPLRYPGPRARPTKSAYMLLNDRTRRCMRPCFLNTKVLLVKLFPHGYSKSQREGHHTRPPFQSSRFV